MLRCLLHLKHNAEDLLKAQSGEDQRTPRLFLTWLNNVPVLKTLGPALPVWLYAREAAELQEWWDWLHQHVVLVDANERNPGFRERLAAAEGQILPILWEQGLPAANNRAEQQIRPAVVIRKISAGNKTKQGARTHEVLASLAATCRQQGVAFAKVVRDILLGGGEPVPFWSDRPTPSQQGTGLRRTVHNILMDEASEPAGYWSSSPAPA